MWKRPAGLLFVLIIAAASATALGARLSNYATQPLASAEALTAVPINQRQTSNAIARSDRAALLRDSPSYTNFDPGLLALAISSLAKRLSETDAGIGFLSEGQIAGIANRLQLTEQQAQYWPPVAAALRDIGRKYFPAARHRRHAVKIETDSPEVKRLVEAAMPLILQLTEKQKREVRQLARIIGMEKLASQI